MDFGHAYMVNWAGMISTADPKAVMLDYGCGSGQVVAAGLAMGLDIRGTDPFCQGASSRRDVEESNLLGVSVFEMERDGTIPFEDGIFDFVLSNQVFEHVDDLSRPLGEICRVVKDDGLFLAAFPTAEVIPEGHIGIPLAHWFKPGSSFRRLYVLALRTIGLGYFKRNGERPRHWTERQLKWLDDYTQYRPYDEMRRSFGERFRTVEIQDDFLREKLSATKSLFALAPLSGLAAGNLVGRRLLPLFFCRVFLCRKRNGIHKPAFSSPTTPERLKRLLNRFG